MPRLLPALLLALCAPLAIAGDYRTHPDFLALVDELVQQDGLPRAELVTLLDGARRQPAILEAIARPAEKALTWAEYRPRFVEEKRIARGVAFWREQAPALARAEAQHGVPAEIIVAIIGVETHYGRNKGRWKVVDALATLAFDYPPRAAFFRQQLKEFVRLERSAHIRLADVTGSYAGAMGYPQFMPSSYRAFAVDFDGDGITDLINSPVDAIGSVANYLRAHGWQRGAPVAARLRLDPDAGDWAATVNQGLDPKFTPATLATAGLAPLSCLGGGITPDYCADPATDEPVTAWQLQGARGAEFWLGMRNFHAITRYNRSAMYALAVLQLGTEVRLRKRIEDAQGGPR